MTRQEARQIIATWLVSSKGAKGQRGYIEGWFDEEDVEAFRMAIEALSTERPTGEWTDNHNGTFTCDQCGCKHSKSNYCPNCGAKMRGEEE